MVSASGRACEGKRAKGGRTKRQFVRGGAERGWKPSHSRGRGGREEVLEVGCSGRWGKGMVEEGGVGRDTCGPRYRGREGGGAGRVPATGRAGEGKTMTEMRKEWPWRYQERLARGREGEARGGETIAKTAERS